MLQKLRAYFYQCYCLFLLPSKYVLALLFLYSLTKLTYYPILSTNKINVNSFIHLLLPNTTRKTSLQYFSRKWHKGRCVHMCVRQYVDREDAEHIENRKS